MATTEARPRPRRAETSLISFTCAVWAVALAAVAFATLKSPAEAADASGMVAIPPGEYPIGPPAADGNPIARRETVEAFLIDRGEVSNADYAEYLSAEGGSAPGDWPNGQMPAGEGDLAIDGVSKSRAAAYCRSLGKRLPTEAEWEAAGRGLQGQLLPWAGAPDRFDLAVATATAEGLEATASPFGVRNLRGGVWEWVDDPLEPVESGLAVIRGGSTESPTNLTGRQVIPQAPTQATGFRCAASEFEDGTITAFSPVVFRDDFSSASSGWPTFAGSEAELAIDAGGTLRYSIRTTDRGALIPAAAASGADVEVEVTTRLHTLPSGSHRYGVAIRGADGQALLFVLEDGGRTWQIAHLGSPEGGGGAQFQTLAEGPSPTIADAPAHRLRLRAIAGEVTAEINGELVGQITTDLVQSGAVGVYAESIDAPELDVHFDDFTLRNGAGRPFIDRTG